MAKFVFSNPLKIAIRILLTIIVLILLVAAFSFISYKYVHAKGDGLLLYKEYNPTITKREYALVPGGAVSDGRPGDQLKYRLDTSIALLEDNLAKKVMISGSEYEVKVMEKYLLDHDVHIETIIKDPFSEDTLDTIKRAYEFSPKSEFYVCTQKFYSYRTGYLIKAVGLNAKIINADLIIFQGTLKNKSREYFAATKAVLETKITKIPATKHVDEYEMETSK